MNLATMIVLWAAAMTAHEMGHYAAYRAYGYVARIRFTWYGVCYIGEEVYRRLSIQQYYLVSLAGVLAGAPLIILAGEPVIYIAYVLGCSIDIINMTLTIKPLLKEPHTNLGDYIIRKAQATILSIQRERQGTEVHT